MPRMLTALVGIVSLCVISQLYSADAAPKRKTTDGVLVIDQKDIAAAQRNADEVGKVQRFYLHTSPDGVKRQEIKPSGNSDRAPSSPRSAPSTSSYF